MSKLVMLGRDGFTFFYGLEDIRLISFMKADDFYDHTSDMHAEGFTPETNLIVIYFNDGLTYCFNSAKYSFYFE